MYNPASHHYLRGMMAALALVFMLPGAGNPSRTAEARPTSAPSASVFYPITKTAYDAWTTSTSNSQPAKATSFSARTTVVCFYAEYHGAKANGTSLILVVKNSAGVTVVSDGPFRLKHAEGLLGIQMNGPGGMYPNGSYGADLTLDGRVAAHTSFVVGAKPTAVSRLFYPATREAYDAWVA